MKLDVQPIASPRVEMMPLIDIVFLLLVFFIYAMLSMVVHHGQMVNLPTSTQVVVEPEQVITLTIKDGASGVSLLLDGQSVEMAQLVAQLQEGHQKDLAVQVFADQAILYQELFQVMDQLKKAGVETVSLQADLQTEPL